MRAFLIVIIYMRKVHTILKCAYLANVETHNLACTILKFKAKRGGMVLESWRQEGILESH